MTKRRVRCGLAAFALALAGCASGEPLDMSLPTSTSQIEVVMLGDGFVRTGGRRVPREAFVLELRQATRRMTPSALAGLLIVVRVEADERTEHEGQSTAATDAGWLIDQLDIMDVGQAQYVPGPR